MLKEWLNKKIPMWVLLLSIVTFVNVYKFWEPDPDFNGLILHIAACDRFLNKPSIDFAKEYMEQTLKEMEALYVVTYGIIPKPIVEELKRIKTRFKSGGG